MIARFIHRIWRTHAAPRIPIRGAVVRPARLRRAGSRRSVVSPVIAPPADRHPVEPPITRETLYEVFGPRALRWGLFYVNERALRFELSTSGSRLGLFEGAWDRGREILDAVFHDTEPVVVVLSWIVERRSPLGHLAVFRALRNCGVGVERPYEVWTETSEEEWSDVERVFVAFRAGRDAIRPLLWGALAVDLGIRPRLLCEVYLADVERGVLAHPYDDRGMDVIGPNHPFLRDLYTRFTAYLLDFDRARMDADFGEG